MSNYYSDPTMKAALRNLNGYGQYAGKLNESLVSSVAIYAKMAFKDRTGTRLDYVYGTDFEIEGLRVDVTLNFANKDHTYRTGERFNILWGAETVAHIDYGIRYANDHHRFVEPVLVLGTTMDNGYDFRRADDRAKLERALRAGNGGRFRRIIERGQELMQDYKQQAISLATA